MRSLSFALPCNHHISGYLLYFVITNSAYSIKSGFLSFFYHGFVSADLTPTIVLAIVISLIVVIIIAAVLYIKFRKRSRPVENERRLTMDDVSS